MFDLKELPRVSNKHSWFVAPPGWRPSQDQDAVAPVFNVTEDELWFIWKQVTANSKRIVAEELQETERRSYHVQLTPMLKFPDEVRAEILPAENGKSTLALYSRSRYGLYDLGVNRKRVERWLERLDRRVMAYRRFQRRQSAESQ